LRKTTREGLREPDVTNGLRGIHPAYRKHL
jgi:hypothetical protein